MKSERQEWIDEGQYSGFFLTTLVGAAMTLLAVVFLGKFYIDVVLVPPGLLALAIVLSRAFDALTDPLMGYISDHTRSRWGRRRPWIVLGVIGNAVMFWLLLNPPETLEPVQAGWWCVGGFVLSYLFVTVGNVPRTALAVELTLDDAERRRLFVGIAAAAGLGAMVGALMPAAIGALGVTDSREQFSVQAWMYVLAFVLTNALLLWNVRERPEFMGRGEAAFIPGLRWAWRNRPFRIMFLSHVITAIPIAMPAGLLVFYAQYVLGVGEGWIAAFVLMYLFAGVCALPLWALAAAAWGKKNVWLAASVIAVSGGLLLFLAGPGDQWYVLAVNAWVGLQSAVWFFLGGAMHADVVDYDELLTGKRREAQFSAFWGFIPKFALIPGAAVPIAVLGVVGYQPGAAVQNEAVQFWLCAMYALVPALINAVGLAIMWWYPLTEDKRQLVRDAIALNAQGKPAIDPLTGKTLLPLAQREWVTELGWFLDHFSLAELQAVVKRQSADVLRWRIMLAVVLLSVVSAVLVLLAILGLGDFSSDPGAGPTLAVFAAGLSIAALCYELLRLRPVCELQRRLRARELEWQQLDVHLAQLHEVLR